MTSSNFMQHTFIKFADLPQCAIFATRLNWHRYIKMHCPKTARLGGYLLAGDKVTDSFYWFDPNHLVREVV